MFASSLIKLLMKFPQDMQDEPRKKTLFIVWYTQFSISFEKSFQ